MSWWDEFKSAIGHWFLNESAAKSGVTITHLPNPPQVPSGAGDGASQLPAPAPPPEAQPKPPKALPAQGQSSVPQTSQPTANTDPLSGVAKIATSLGSLGSLISSGAKAYKDLGLGSKSGAGSDKKIIKDSDKDDEKSDESDNSENSDESTDSDTESEADINDSSEVVD